MPFDFLKTAFATLLVTFDPPGLAPIFLGLTLGLSPEGKRQVAVRGSLIAFAILAVFALLGRPALDALGISIPAFRLSGGLLLFFIAFDMVFGLRTEKKREIASDAVEIDHIRNIAAFPLAIPLMAGPGSITATMLLASRAGGDWLEIAGLLGVAATVVAICFVILLAAGRVADLLGQTGNIVLTRMLGVVLAALAAQFCIDGARGAFAP